MRWQPIESLHEPLERGTELVFCHICNKRLPIAHFANTELAQDFARGTGSHCSIAYRLPCGHIVVDDCDSDDLNGLTFPNEAEWRKKIVSSYDKGW